MLAHWPAGPYLMGLVRFAGDEASAPLLHAKLLERAQQIAQKESWPNAGARLPGMVQLALWELLRGPACRACGGVGYIPRPGAPAKHCDVCDGKRVRRMTEAEKASAAGMGERNWRRGWSDRYERIFNVARGWEDESLARMKRILRANGE